MDEVFKYSPTIKKTCQKSGRIESNLFEIN